MSLREVSGVGDRLCRSYSREVVQPWAKGCLCYILFVSRITMLVIPEVWTVFIIKAASCSL